MNINPSSDRPPMVNVPFSPCSGPRFARRIARRYQVYRILALLGVGMLAPVACISALLVKNPIFAFVFVIALIGGGALIGLAAWCRQRVKQAKMGERAELRAVDQLRSIFPDFHCCENMEYTGGDIDIVLSNMQNKIVLVIEVKAYRKVDHRIDTARMQVRRAAFAIRDRLNAAKTPAFVIMTTGDMEKVYAGATCVVPLVFLPYANEPSNDPFLLTQRDVPNLRSKIDRLLALRGSHSTPAARV
jgi:hypothetical protein